MKECIIKLKNKLGWTSEILAEKSKVPIGTINKILNGETPNPRVSTAKAIAHALGCTIDYLMEEDGLTINSSMSFIDEKAATFCKEMYELCILMGDDNKNRLVGYAHALVEEYKKGCPGDEQKAG